MDVIPLGVDFSPESSETAFASEATLGGGRRGAEMEDRRSEIGDRCIGASVGCLERE